MKRSLVYYLLPLIYIGAVLLMEFFPNILSAGVWVLSIVICIAALFQVAFKKIPAVSKVIFILVLSIPAWDIAFNLSYTIRNKIKGEIVLSAIDDSFAATRSITVRQKNGLLKTEYDFSAAGIGEVEQADVTIESDSVIVINVKERNYSERLVFDRQKGQIIDNTKGLFYRVMENKILK